MTELLTGLALGFLGSAHCVGMCGPLALALPGRKRSGVALALSRLVYNIGRVVTYAFIGALVGMIGEGFAMAGLQRWLSITAGVALALVIISPTRVTRRIIPTGAYLWIESFIQRKWRSLQSRQGAGALFVIGLLNGLLPCGFVYLALAGAASVGSVTHSALFMSGFGIGTIPAMFAVSLIGGISQIPLRKHVTKLTPVVGIALATLLVLRGLSLGIPYISPNIADAHTVNEVEQCH